MEENSPKKRGRPPKNKTPTTEVNTQNKENTYEFNTNLPYGFTIDTIFDDLLIPFKIEEIRSFLQKPMLHIKELRDLAWWAYHSNGSVSSSVDYMRSLHTLDSEIVCKNRNNKNVSISKLRKNKTKMASILEIIKYKQLIKDSILKNANDGMYFYYFEITNAIQSKQKFMNDIEIYNIVDINELGINASVIPLPIDYCKIIGRKNNSYVGAFDLRYFEQFNDGDCKKNLRLFPKEIRDGWNAYQLSKINGNWIILDNTKTIINKIKSAINEPYGIPYSISALDDILYEDYFINTKRNVLDQINNQIFYQTFPEGKEKGTSSLSQKQQEEQHNTIKNAILGKNNNGKAFFSLANGTELNQIKVDLSIFDEKNEAGIEDNVTKSLGIASCLLDGNSKGNYATATINLELVSANVYSWICDFVDELNKVINENIIKDDIYKMQLYILPTTFVNRDKQVKYLADLYARGKGSLRAWISSTGFDSDVYLALMEQELNEDIENKFPVHKTSFTISGKDSENSDIDKSSGRNKVEDATNSNTIKSQMTNSNSNPKPSK